MSKSNSLETSILSLLFNATAIANIADNAASGPLTNLQVSLHTSDPGEAGSQNTNEATYGGYARVAVARTTSGWAVSGNSVSPVSTIDFPECTAGSNTATHFGVGTATAGAGVLLYKGAITPNISISSAVIPRLKVTSAITED